MYQQVQGRLFNRIKVGRNDEDIVALGRPVNLPGQVC
jgi:hypothetical protein